MAALGPPARTLRGLLRELRYMNAGTGRPYRDTEAYRYLVKAFRAHRVRKPESACSSVPTPGWEAQLGGAGVERAGPERLRFRGRPSALPRFRPEKPSSACPGSGPRPKPRTAPACGGAVTGVAVPEAFIGCPWRAGRRASGEREVRERGRGKVCVLGSVGSPAPASGHLRCPLPAKAILRSNF